MLLRMVLLLKVLLFSFFLLFSNFSLALEPSHLPLYPNPTEEEVLVNDLDNTLENAIHSLKNKQKIISVSKPEVLQINSSQLLNNMVLKIHNPVDLFPELNIAELAIDDFINSADNKLGIINNHVNNINNANEANNVNEVFAKKVTNERVENQSAQDFFSKGKDAALKTLASIFSVSTELSTKTGLEKSNSFLQGFNQLQPMEKYFLLGMAFLSLLLLSFTIIIFIRFRRFKLQLGQGGKEIQVGKEIPKATMPTSLEAYLEANALASNINIDTIKDTVKQDAVKLNIKQPEALKPKWDRFNNLLIDNQVENQAAETNIPASHREAKDEMSLRLSLAETYFEMADKENALLLLKEVQQKGNATEKALAEKLLAKY